MKSLLIRLILEQDICIAIVQSYSYLTKAKIMENQQWEIIASERDSKKLAGFGFFKHNCAATLNTTRQNPKGIISKIMDTDVISEFRLLLPEYFTQVIKTEDGAVYELKDHSFKQYVNRYSDAV
ncbi:hypothetical protein [Chryseobacterium sp. CCH4-E10]|uniref:hypothetical protein n=1 Tax=Chryseobacterium sp. CCH4-E10 TaxID=1768758 RepID=UPI000AB05543|nr:hypothetical protein [Chryseobacterium sp. CCH4-E10]